MDYAKYKDLAKNILDSTYTVILTGAGMSTESGVADFRSKDGIWAKYDPMKVASIDALKNDYDNFHAFYVLRSNTKVQREPHIGHKILAKWENEGHIKSIITQNVDNFHNEAGSKNVYPIHGSITEFRCSECDEKTSKESFINKTPCEKCGGNLRPGIVLFGESLPIRVLENAIYEVEKADLVIIIGTSLSVYPAANLHSHTKGKVVYINDENTAKKRIDIFIEGKAGKVLLKVDEYIDEIKALRV